MGKGRAPEDLLAPLGACLSDALRIREFPTLPCLHSAWYWGYCAVYDSGGYIQELGLSLEESRARLGFLQLHNWLDSRWVLSREMNRKLAAPLAASCPHASR